MREDTRRARRGGDRGSRKGEDTLGPAAADATIVPAQEPVARDDQVFFLTSKNRTQGDCGGKASGLQRLLQAGLSVPRAFVFLRRFESSFSGSRLSREEQRALSRAYGELGGGVVAVRSSAADEDGVEASFAGQFETFLNVKGEEALFEAVGRCLESAHNTRSSSYRKERLKATAQEAQGARQLESAPPKMAVVVQEMVRAQAAGVVFTADPVTGVRHRVHVDAVAGTGEKLVSGAVTPDHYEVAREVGWGGGHQSHRAKGAEGATPPRMEDSAEVVREEPAGEAPVLSREVLHEVARGALRAEKVWGVPLDLEWALDGRGKVRWLQARPITTAPGDMHEFDTPVHQDDVFTRANFGEMMPGPMTPLTISTTCYGIDQGIQQMMVHCRAQEALSPDPIVVGVTCGHIFFRLSAMLPFCSRVGGSDPDKMTLAIVGRQVQELQSCPPTSRLERLLNGLRYAHYTLGARRDVKALERALESFRVEKRATPMEMYWELDRKLEMLVWTYKVHLRSSAASGLSDGVMHEVVAPGRVPTAEDEARMARLLQGAEGVESAGLVEALDGVAEALANTPEVWESLVERSPEEALEWLQSSGSGAGGRAFRSFLERHGDRAFRELSMYEKGWGDDPVPLVISLQRALRGRGIQGASGRGAEGGGAERNRATRGAEVKKLSLPLRGVVRWARSTVRGREHTKALLVKVTNRLKQGYRHLARLLESKGILPDEDALFFFTHDELGELIRVAERATGGGTGGQGAPAAQEHPSELLSELLQLAAHRRLVFGRQWRLRFPHLTVGRPRPVDPRGAVVVPEGGLLGKPVSPGCVKGLARVAHSLDEAAALEPGEILIAPITDVGWTPYFNLIAGLATDVGSAISHGAVVAREYGLPAVVNLKTATQSFETGEPVLLDGDRGVLKKLE